MTEVDKAVEAFIVQRITETYPDHMLYGSFKYWANPADTGRVVSGKRAITEKRSRMSQPGLSSPLSPSSDKSEADMRQSDRWDNKLREPFRSKLNGS